MITLEHKDILELMAYVKEVVENVSPKIYDWLAKQDVQKEFKRYKIVVSTEYFGTFFGPQHYEGVITSGIHQKDTKTVTILADAIVHSSVDGADNMYEVKKFAFVRTLCVLAHELGHMAHRLFETKDYNSLAYLRTYILEKKEKGRLIEDRDIDCFVTCVSRLERKADEYAKQIFLPMFNDDAVTFFYNILEQSSMSADREELKKQHFQALSA